MKTGQNVIVFTKGDESYICGSIRAIYNIYTPDELGISYASLRNSISRYMKENGINEDKDIRLKTIYTSHKHRITIQRGVIVLAEKQAGS